MNKNTIYILFAILIVFISNYFYKNNYKDHFPPLITTLLASIMSKSHVIKRSMKFLTQHEAIAVDQELFKTFPVVVISLLTSRTEYKLQTSQSLHIRCFFSFERFKHIRLYQKVIVKLINVTLCIYINTLK